MRSHWVVVPTLDEWPLAHDGHLLADHRAAVHEKRYGRLHVGQEGGRLGVDSLRQRLKRLNWSDKMRS